MTDFAAGRRPIANQAAQTRTGTLPPRRYFPAALPPSDGPITAARGGTSEAGLDAQAVVYRLEEAGTTLLCLPNTGPSTRLRTSTFEVVAAAVDGTSWATAPSEPSRLRPLPPNSARIDRMDEAFGWLALIPRDRYVLRRIVGARALVSPITERHLFSWRRLGTAMGADHKAVQRLAWRGHRPHREGAAGRVIRPGGDPARPAAGVSVRAAPPRAGRRCRRRGRPPDDRLAGSRRSGRPAVSRPCRSACRSRVATQCTDRPR